jgi:hypothetical protein
MHNFPSSFRRGQGVVNPPIADHPWGCSPGSRPADGLRNEERVMLIRVRRRDDKCQKTQMVESEGIVPAACAHSTACYKVQKPVSRIVCGQI